MPTAECGGQVELGDEKVPSSVLKQNLLSESVWNASSFEVFFLRSLRLWSQSAKCSSVVQRGICLNFCWSDIDSSVQQEAFCSHPFITIVTQIPAVSRWFAIGCRQRWLLENERGSHADSCAAR